MILSEVSLLYEKIVRLENAVDYMKEEIFVIQYRQSVLKVPIELARAKLDGIRIAKAGVTKMKAIMKIGKDLIDIFKAYDIYTKSATSVVFDARTAFRVSQGHDMIVKDG